MGSSAHWAHSGPELFFEGANGDFMVVPMTPGATLSPGELRRLFPLGGALFGSAIVPYYDLTPDDKRFVMVRLAAVTQAPGARQLVVENWLEELRQKMEPERN